MADSLLGLLVEEVSKFHVNSDLDVVGLRTLSGGRHTDDGLDTVDGDEKTGVKIVIKALEEPVRQIAANAGFDGGVVVDKILSSGKLGYGFDAYNETYVDMIEAGIVDPVKVTRTALENAASIAGCVLTTESLVVDKPDPAADAAMAAAAAQGGGMY